MVSNFNKASTINRSLNMSTLVGETANINGDNHAKQQKRRVAFIEDEESEIKEPEEANEQVETK